jgi:hypothetical protein
MEQVMLFRDWMMLWHLSHEWDVSAEEVKQEKVQSGGRHVGKDVRVCISQLQLP